MLYLGILIALVAVILIERNYSPRIFLQRDGILYMLFNRKKGKNYIPSIFYIGKLW